MINNNQNQQLIYHLYNALAEFQKESNDFLNKIQSFHGYMIQRFENGDIALSDIEEINKSFEFYKNETIIRNQHFSTIIDSHVKRRGYNSLNEIDKININTDYKLYGLSQSDLANKYYTYQKVIHRILKEIDEASTFIRNNFINNNKGGFY